MVEVVQTETFIEWEYQAIIRAETVDNEGATIDEDGGQSEECIVGGEEAVVLLESEESYRVGVIGV